MLGRLILGIVKGLIVGGLLGYAVAELGFVAPPGIVAYLAAALTGVVIGLVAGKPIWAKDAKIEAGMKAAIGALLGAGLMYAVRRWLVMPVPVSLGVLGGPNLSLGEAEGTAGTLGGLAVTSLAIIAATLGGFYEADNTPEAAEPTPPAGKAGAQAGRRIAAADEDEVEDDAAAEPGKKQHTKN